MLDENVDGFIFTVGLLTTLVMTGGILVLAGYGALVALGFA